MAGPSGHVVVVSRLSNSPEKHLVLFLKAGGNNIDYSYWVLADRYAPAVKEPALN